MKFDLILILVFSSFLVFTNGSTPASPQDPDCANNTVDPELLDNPDLGVGGLVVEDPVVTTQSPVTVTGGTVEAFPTPEIPGSSPASSPTTVPSETETNASSIGGGSTSGGGGASPTPSQPPSTQPPAPSTSTIFPTSPSSTCTDALCSLQETFQQIFTQLLAYLQELLGPLLAALGIDIF